MTPDDEMFFSMLGCEVWHDPDEVLDTNIVVSELHQPPKPSTFDRIVISIKRVIFGNP